MGAVGKHNGRFAVLSVAPDPQPLVAGVIRHALDTEKKIGGTALVFTFANHS